MKTAMPNKQQTAPICKQFKYSERTTLPQLFDSMAEQYILKHWRVHEPQKVEALLSEGMLRLNLTFVAKALWDLQRSLQKSEKLPLPLARLEAWRQLMRAEQDAEEEASAWGMTAEEHEIV